MNTAESYMKLLEAAMSGHDGEAVYRLGELYQEGDDLQEDLEKAIHYFELAYEQGYDIPPYLLVTIGSTYVCGDRYHKKDSVTAKELYQEAAEKGVDYAYACIGELYYNGEGVEQDYSKAFSLFKRSGECETLALYYLGLMYERGNGVAQSFEKAEEYYSRILTEFSVLKEYGDVHYSLAEKRMSMMNIKP